MQPFNIDPVSLFDSNAEYADTIVSNTAEEPAAAYGNVPAAIMARLRKIHELATEIEHLAALHDKKSTNHS